MSDVTTVLESADEAIRDFLKVDARNCKPEEFGRLHAKASIGLRVRHDQAVNERVAIDQKLKAINMIATKPELREQYIRATAPQMVPQLEARPK
jgi:hypothetical protein